MTAIAVKPFVETLQTSQLDKIASKILTVFHSIITLSPIWNAISLGALNNGVVYMIPFTAVDYNLIQKRIYNFQKTISIRLKN